MSESTESKVLFKTGGSTTTNETFFDRLGEDFFGTLGGLGGEFLENYPDLANLLGGYAIEKFGGDFFNAPPPTVGYQGDVPRYTAVREQVYPSTPRIGSPPPPRQDDFVHSIGTTVYSDYDPVTGTVAQSVGGIAGMMDLGRINVNEVEDAGFTDALNQYLSNQPSAATQPNLMSIAEGDALTRRRPGSAGRRYFTDTLYAETPEVPMPTLAEARQRVGQQAQGIRSIQNRTAPMQDTDTSDSNVTENVTTNPSDVTDVNPIPTYEDILEQYPVGGVAMAEGGRYLAGSTDGMADVVPARIEGGQEARLSDGEFVVPADVVSHLGNGNSDAGAKQLYGMMDDVREARTGRKEQGIQIDPNKFMPNMAQGGIAKFKGADGSLVEGTDSDIAAANENAQSGVTGIDPEGYTPVGVGRQGALAEFAGEYTTDLLGKGRAIAETPYEAYTGPLTAGESGLETQAFQGLAGLQAPETMGGYTPTTLDATQVSRFMNPYLEATLNPQIEAAIRQAEIQRVADAGRLTKAGAYGGSRQAVMEAEGQRALQDRIAGITGQGYATAYDKALARFDQEEARQREAQQMANKYGFDVLGAQTRGGQLQRAIEGEGIAADRAQFEEEKLFPYKQIQYQKSLLEGLPISAQEIQYSQPSGIQNVLGNTAFLSQLLGNTDPEDGNILTDIFNVGSDFIDLFD
tara:strand:- start:224 stop:2287 length:2064 start_codon:yes stop_codon:yes gene_type:complete